MIYSSDPTLARVGAPGGSPSDGTAISVVRPQHSHFQVTVLPSVMGKKMCRLHAVSTAKDQQPHFPRVLASWLFVVTGTRPKVSEVRDVNLPIGVEADKRLGFRNVHPRHITYLLSSSDPGRVRILNPTIDMEPLEYTQINLHFPADLHMSPHAEDVFLFITSSDRVSRECHLLRLQYT